MNENLIANATKLGLGEGQAAANMLVGSQLGVGLRAKNLDAATPLVFPPAQIVVLQTPTMYANEHETAQMIKTLLETHAKAVTGIDFGYTLETSGQVVGHDGQEMHVPTKAKRSAVNPSFTFHEVSGNLIWNLFTQWLRDIQDPDTNASMTRLQTQDPYMMSTYALSMVVIQFDPSNDPDKIVDAAFYTNMFPTDPGGPIGFERTIGTSKVMERVVNFTGIVQHNRTTRLLGVKIAKQLMLAKISYEKAATGSSEVNTMLADSGLQKQVNEMLSGKA
jgi:hypothetical protein